VASINPMRIHIVDNPHEVEYHKLEVKYIHLLNTRAAAPLAMASFPGLTYAPHAVEFGILAC
jgi:hypothetical protein